jgi:heme exporter protein B
MGMNRFSEVVRRDLRLALRQASDSATIVVFFLLAVALFPLAVGPESNLLERISAGVLWVAALLSAMLSLDRLFLADYEDGSLELLVLTPAPLSLLVLGKVAAHWLTTGLPLMIAAPLLAVLLHLDKAGFVVLVAAMALGTPILSLVGALGAALALGARRGGVLISLLVLPLCVPVLIFGAGAIDQAVQGLTPRPQLMMLAGLLLAALPLAPLAAAAALRQAVE